CKNDFPICIQRLANPWKCLNLQCLYETEWMDKKPRDTTQILVNI
ncbi:unnamed protein product, partial [Brachionus calyciflorus]